MYWNERDNTPSTSGSSGGSSTPSTPSSDLPASPLNKNSWPTPTLQNLENFTGGETVWPLDLEAALLEGLEKYQPDDSRETRMLGRFPRRNRFISDYIFDKTGKRRSPKQVGSRLQQLRESCGGTQCSSSSGSNDSGPSSPISPLEDGLFGASSSHSTVIYIDILPAGSPDRTRIGSSPSPWPDAGDVIHASDHPRRIESINPTVSFTAPSPVVAHSRFTVYSEDLIPPRRNGPPSTSGGSASPSVGLRVQYPTNSKILESNSGQPRQIPPDLRFSKRHSTNIPSSHPGSYNSRPDVPTKGMTPYNASVSQPDPRYPVYDNVAWNATSLHPQEASHVHRYPNQNGDSTYLYFPDMSNYVSS
ncbi:TEA domain-containing protein [Mycena venus]|uniref:TEA domain-containing protein n=1 Tax=Mycena venus TaxID=2733690 RepID=A0A8H6X809_9AGAR|nr:TEA domain-containing protein [Mycena venus]